MQMLALMLAAVLAPQFDGAPQAQLAQESSSHNILIVMLDDFGVDQLRLTADPSVSFPPAYDTPNIDALADRGVLFTNAWANPYCSPTRATIQTGLYSFRPNNGIGTVIERGCCKQFFGVPCREAQNCCRGCPDWSLPHSGIELPNRLPGHLSSAFGKWHLEDKHFWRQQSSNIWPEMRREHRLWGPSRSGRPRFRHERDYPGPDFSAPCEHGYDFFAGTLWQIPWLPQPQCNNHQGSGCPAGEGITYCTWGITNIESGGGGHTRSVNVTTDYMPQRLAESAGAWIDAIQTLQPGVPWLCYLAPQTPYEFAHVPPSTLQDVKPGLACTTCGKFDRECYLAAVEAFDDRLGHVLSKIGPDWWTTTTVIFLGDNGTTQNINTATGFWPEGRAKTTLWNGGVCVPLIVAGKAVDSSLWSTTSDELVNTVDLYATAVEIGGGVVPPWIDGISLAPYLATTGTWPRTWNYAEIFEPNGKVVPQGTHEVAIRDDRYKLIRKCWDHSQDAFFDLQVDPKEMSPLAIPQVPTDPLWAEFTNLVNSLPANCP